MGKSIRQADPFVLDEQDARNIPSTQRPARPATAQKQATADPFVLNQGDAGLIKKKVGGSGSGDGAFPTPSELSSADAIKKALQNYQDKQLTPADQQLLAQTDWGKQNGLVMPADWQKSFQQAHNGPQTPDLYNSVIKVLNANYPQAAPGTPEARTREQIFQNVQKGDIAAIQKVRQSVLDAKQQQILKIQADPKGEIPVAHFAMDPEYTGSMTRKLSVEQTNQIRQLETEKQAAQSTLDAYTVHAIVGKRENQLQIKAELAPNNTKYSDLTIAARSIGEQIEKTVGLQKRIPNNEYVHTRAGLEAIMTSWNMDINQQLAEGMRTKNPELVKAAHEKIAQLQIFQNRYNNLDNQYPDVGTYKTARYLGDILAETKPHRLLTTALDVVEAGAIAEERNPGFWKSHGKFVDVVARSEGDWTGLKSGMIPQGGFLGGLKAGTEDIGYGGAAFVASPFGMTWDQKTKDQVEIFQQEASMKGTSATGIQLTRVTYDKDNKAYREMPNENYGQWNFNSAVYQLGKGIPALAEFVVLDKGLGGAARGLAQVGVKGLNLIGKDAALVTNTLLGSKDVTRGYEALAVPAAFEKTAGLYAATYITSFDENHKLAESWIDDQSSLGSAKKNVLAHLLTLSTAGVFSMMDYSPTKAVEAAIAKSAGPDVLKTLEKASWENLSQEETAKLIKDQIWPRVKAVIQAGGESVKAGAKLGAASVIDQKIKDLAGFIVNPEKANASSLDDNIHSFVDQVLLMTVVGIPGMVSSGRFPQTSKDALYQAGVLAPQYIDRINERVAAGDLPQETANKMIAMVRTMAKEVTHAKYAFNEEGLPLTHQQQRDEALSNFRKKAATMLKERGADLNEEAIHKEADEHIAGIRQENHWRSVEESIPFQSARDLETGKRPASPQDIDPEKQYTYDKEGTVVTTTGAELSDYLTHGTYEQAIPEDAKGAKTQKEPATEPEKTGDRSQAPAEEPAAQITPEKLATAKAGIEKGIAAGKLTGVYVNLARTQPAEFLQEIADQVYGVVDGGEKATGEDAELAARDLYGDDIVDAAKTLYPRPKPAALPTMVIRHGESTANARKVASTDETPLTAKGEKQATEKGIELQQQGYKDVVASATLRAQQTADKIVAETGGKILDHPELSKLLKEWDQTGGESVDDFVKRIATARDQINQLPPGTAVIAHGKVMGMLEALDKADGDLAKAKELFEQTKVYDNTDTYIPSRKTTDHGTEKGNEPARRSGSGEESTETRQEGQGQQAADGGPDGPQKPEGGQDDQGNVLTPEGAPADTQGPPSLPEEPPASEPPPEEPPAIEPAAPVTGIRNVVVNSERQLDRGLDSVIKQAASSFKEVWERAKDLVRGGEADPRFLVENLHKMPQPVVSDVENAMILMDRIDLTNQRMNLLRAIEEAQQAADVYTEGSLTDQLNLVEQKIQQNDEVADSTGREIARSLSSRRMLATMDYSLAKMTADIRRLYGGENPPETVKEQLARIEREHADLLRKYGEREEAWKAERAEEAFKKAQQSVKKTPPKATKKITLKGKELADKIRSLRPPAADTLQSNIFGLPIAIYDTALVAVANLVEQGARLVDAIDQAIKDLDFASDKDRTDLKAHLLAFEQREATPADERNKLKEKIFADAQKDKARNLVKDNITPLRKMARSHIREGMTTLDQVVDAIHGDLKEGLPDLTKRDVRDAFSGYGDTRLPTRTDLERQMRELKKQGELVSQLEDVQQGQAPARKVKKMEAPSKKVQELRKQVEKAMKTSGISWENPPRTPAEREARALQALKNRLKNEIEHLTERLETGLPPKGKTKVQQDAEAKELTGQRDRLKKALQEIDGQRNLSDANKIKRMENVLKREIERYETQIREGVDPLKPTSEKLMTPALEALKEERNAVRALYKKLRVDNDPASTPQQIALEAYKDRLTRRVNEFQRRIFEGDFEPDERIPIDEDAEAKKIALQLKAEESKFHTIKRKAEEANKGRLQKVLDKVNAWKRFAILSGLPSLGKIVLAVGYRQIGTPVEELIGAGIRHIPGVSVVARQAPREGRGFMRSAESAALREWAKAETYEDFLKVLKKGRGELDVSVGKYIEESPEALEFWGRVHASLKNFAKRSEFARAFEQRVEYAHRQGFDRADELVRMTAAYDAYADASRAIFMQDNVLTKEYYKLIKRLESDDSSWISKMGAFLARFTMPIVKVPTNFIAETGEFALGAFSGTAKIIYNAITGDLSKLSPKEADAIMRSLKKGSIGLTLGVIGFLIPGIAGGYYQRGEQRDENEPDAGEFMFGGHRIPKWATHSPLLEAMQIGATIRRAFERRQEEKGEDTSKAVVGSLLDAASGMLGEVPLFEQPTQLMNRFKYGEFDKLGGDYLKSLNPQLIQNVASWTDQEDGKTVKRAPENILETVETGIPGLRQNVPRK
jgi:histidine phosphatase superfamily protein (branch 1)